MRRTADRPFFNGLASGGRVVRRSPRPFSDYPTTNGLATGGKLVSRNTIGPASAALARREAAAKGKKRSE